ncbi:MBL fold metallo-hydrolase [Candidatus Woesebacteria bacterium]|nr:MAG: MBL fold metallo-hydrolase [Candidatus Woesebacteria bacterium]
MKKLVFHGAAGTVTGSCHLLIGDNNRGLMVDCGMFQGTKEVWDLNFQTPTFTAGEIDNVLLTHAHLDHCGRLPLLARMGFTGNIYATKATRDLTEIVLFDAARIQSLDDGVDPLYTEEDVENILSRFRIVNYETEFTVSGYQVVYKDAGHLLGSASILVTQIDNAKSIVFSGDLGNTPDMLLKPTSYFSKSDTVVMESTYGDRVHPKEDALRILQMEINASENDKSVLMIPAFSLERTQMLLYMMKELKRLGYIKESTPVYLDSPMGINATEIYKNYIPLYNEGIIKEFSEGDPFDFPGLIVTRSAKQSKRIEGAGGVRIIIAGSGMMTGGRIVAHAAKYLSDANNRLVMVGYQGEETLGREIKEGAKEVEIDGETIPVNAQIKVIDSLSAHADQKKLLTWLDKIQGVSKVILIHGEDDGPREQLGDKIREMYKIDNIYLPKLHEEVHL